MEKQTENVMENEFTLSAGGGGDGAYPGCCDT